MKQEQPPFLRDGAGFPAFYFFRANVMFFCRVHGQMPMMLHKLYCHFGFWHVWR